MFGTKRQQGFISLISVVFVSFVLLFAVVSLGQQGIAGRFLLLHFENKEKSRTLAEACVNVAMIAVANNDQYQTTGKTVSVGSETCKIHSVRADTPSSGKSLIKTSAASSQAVTNLEVVVETTNDTVVSWQERPTL